MKRSRSTGSPSATPFSAESPRRPSSISARTSLYAEPKDLERMTPSASRRSVISLGSMRRRRNNSLARALRRLISCCFFPMRFSPHCAADSVQRGQNARPCSQTVSLKWRLVGVCGPTLRTASHNAGAKIRQRERQKPKPLVNRSLVELPRRLAASVNLDDALLADIAGVVTVVSPEPRRTAVRLARVECPFDRVAPAVPRQERRMKDQSRHLAGVRRRELAPEEGGDCHVC